MKRVAFDLTPHLGKEVFVRLVDDDTRGWGHVNFDDFRLHDARPEVAASAAGARRLRSTPGSRPRRPRRR